MQEYDVEDSVLPLQPSLNYTAPELARSKASSAGCSSDIFSFGCLAYHLIARKPLFDCHNNVKMVHLISILVSYTNVGIAIGLWKYMLLFPLLVILIPDP